MSCCFESLSLEYEKVKNSKNLKLGRNVLIAVVNCFTIRISFMIYRSAARLGDGTCEKSLTMLPLIITSVLIFFSLISLLGLCFGLCFEAAPKWVFGAFMMVMSVAVVLFFIFIFFLPGFTGDEVWLRKRFVDDHNRWNKIKTCLAHNNFCKKPHTVYGTTPTHDEFRVMRFSSIQYGCCKPSDECNFEYISPFEWVQPASVVNSTNPDCKSWRNDAFAFCFDCGSCKDGFIHKLMYEWKLEIHHYICILLPSLMFYWIGWFGVLMCRMRPQEKKD